MIHAGAVHHPTHPGLAVGRRHAVDLLGHVLLIDAGLLGAQVNHVVAERLVRDHAEMGLRIPIGSQALLAAGARFDVPLEFTGLQVAQGLAVELVLDD